MRKPVPKAKSKSTSETSEVDRDIDRRPPTPLTDPTAPLGPNQIVRLQDGYKYFGLRTTQIDEHIQSGEIPAPVKLSTSGRARGWFGHQILDWQAKRLAEPRPPRIPRKSMKG